MNMHENHMPDLIFTLPELKSKQNDKFLTFWKKNEKSNMLEKSCVTQNDQECLKTPPEQF